jgi:hypothetical protein
MSVISKSAKSTDNADGALLAAELLQRDHRTAVEKRTLTEAIACRGVGWRAPTNAAEPNRNGGFFLARPVAQMHPNLGGDLIT